MKINIIILLVGMALTSAGCSFQTEATVFPISTPTPQVVRAEAKVVGGPSNVAKISERLRNSADDYRKILFLDTKNGWLLGGSDHLYQTIDGGQNWTRLQISVEKGAAISDFFFVNSSIGWLWIRREGNVNKNDTKSWLLRTLDAGQTWQQLVVTDLTSIDTIYFLNAKDGWMTGDTSTRENVYDRTEFLRRTDDGGNTWTEMGEALFRKNGFEDSRQFITGLIVENPESLKVSMFSDRLFETKDGGKNWSQLGPQFDFPPQTTTANFGKLGDKGRLRMARGTWSIEGIYSYIATEKNSLWTVRWTDEPVCIYDILFISETNFLAVGKRGVNLYKKDQQTPGVVLYSNDSGENLQVLYQSKTNSEINSITKVTDDRFLAVGDKGLMLDIQLGK